MVRAAVGPDLDGHLTAVDDGAALVGRPDRLPPVPARVPRARGSVRDALAAGMMSGMADDAELAASEVVTNATEQAGTRVTTSLSSPQGEVRSGCP